VSNDLKTIFMVDDNASNLMLGRNLLSEKYNVFTCNSGARMFKLLEKITPHLILLDIEMPEMDGYEAVKLLKENQNTAGIPVIFLTGHDNAESETRGRALGVVDYIIKPFAPSFLLQCIETHLANG